MSKFDPAAFGRFVGRETRRLVRDAIAPVVRELETTKALVEIGLQTRIKQLESRPVVEIDQVALRRSVRDELKSEFEKMLEAAVAAAAPVFVESYLKAYPPANGRDGRDGIDGKDGTDGMRGEPGPAGEKGIDGANGADGLGLAGAMIDREGSLQITLTNGEVKSLGKVVGKDGEHGHDGASFESFELEYLPESHEVYVKASAAGRTKELRYPAGGIRPAGYWREGTKAEAGEAWVHEGSLWIARKSTPTKPAIGIDDWIIAARKGRDGDRGAKGGDNSPPAPILLKV